MSLRPRRNVSQTKQQKNIVRQTAVNKFSASYFIHTWRTSCWRSHWRNILWWINVDFLGNKMKFEFVKGTINIPTNIKIVLYIFINSRVMNEKQEKCLALWKTELIILYLVRMQNWTAVENCSAVWIDRLSAMQTNDNVCGFFLTFISTVFMIKETEENGRNGLSIMLQIRSVVREQIFH